MASRATSRQNTQNKCHRYETQSQTLTRAHRPAPQRMHLRTHANFSLVFNNDFSLIMNTLKPAFISWLKAQQAFFEENPVLYHDEWLTFAQELQRRINNTFRVTACQVTLRFSDVFNTKAVDIQVCRKEVQSIGCNDYELFAIVTLRCEHNKPEYEIKSQRLLLNQFINKLIAEL